MTYSSKFAVALIASPMLLAGAAFAADVEAPAGDQFDLAIQAIISSDRINYGVTETNHMPWGQIKITPSYGIFYGTLSVENQKYTNVADPDLVKGTVKASVGMTPEFGDLSVDFNLQRRWKFDNVDSFRWLPYVTATYKFSDQLSASLGGGYYYFDTGVNKNFWELYGAVDFTPLDALTLHSEFSYDPQSDFDNNDYLELIGTATVKVTDQISLSGSVGYENYMSNSGTPNALPSYTWYDVGADYAFNDHMSFGVHYQTSDLGNDLVDPNSKCLAQAFSDCEARIFATLTLNGKLSDLKK